MGSVLQTSAQVSQSPIPFLWFLKTSTIIIHFLGYPLLHMQILVPLEKLQLLISLMVGVICYGTLHITDAKYYRNRRPTQSGNSPPPYDSLLHRLYLTTRSQGSPTTKSPQSVIYTPQYLPCNHDKYTITHLYIHIFIHIYIYISTTEYTGDFSQLWSIPISNWIRPWYGVIPNYGRNMNIWNYLCNSLLCKIYLKIKLINHSMGLSFCSYIDDLIIFQAVYW